MGTKFYEFTQNNSGGEFDIDGNVCHRVIVEAENEEHAKSIFEPMIENQSGSCSCCGERWSSYDPDEIALPYRCDTGYPIGVYSHYKDAEERWFKLYGEFPRLVEPKWGKNIAGSREFSGKIWFENIEQYAQFMANAYGWTVPDVRIHRLDGSKTDIFKVNID